jgi:hypothetical protein
MYVLRDAEPEIVAMLGVYVDNILLMCDKDFMKLIKRKIQKVWKN